MAGAARCRILVAEDEGLIAQDIAGRLKAMGHHVTAIVSTAEEAVKEAARADIVLMDIRMDGPGDGIQAAERIRERHAKPVIFLTAHADRPTLERAKLAVPFGYVVKPVQSATLAATLDVAVYKHRVEQELAEQRSLFDAVLTAVSDAIIVAGPTGAVRLMNRAATALTGWTADEAKGKPIQEVLPLFGRVLQGQPEDPVPLALLRNEPIEIAEGTTLAVRDGRRLAVEGSAAPVHVSRIPTGVVLQLRDVSSRQWEEGQIRLACKMDATARLAAGVSSEYANLLAAIRNRAAKLMEQFPEHAVLLRVVEEIDSAAAAAEKITRRLSGLGARQLPNPEVFSVNGLLRRTRKLVESVAGGHVTVTLQLDPAAGKVWADAAQMEQVLMTLVIHASASMQEAGRLKIETGNKDVRASGAAREFVRLAVTHSGNEPGAETLFDPSPLDDHRLALSITHNIVIEHGGYLSAFPLPGGYCFEALLPRYAGPQSYGDPENDPETVTPLAVPSILLVEPNASLRRELQNFFEANRFRLLEASNVTEALALAELHEGSLDVAIAADTDAEALAAPLRRIHPNLKLLQIMDIEIGDTGERRNTDPDGRADELPDTVIPRPLNQTVLLERVRALIGQPQEPQAATAG